MRFRAVVLVVVSAACYACCGAPDPVPFEAEGDVERADIPWLFDVLPVPVGPECELACQAIADPPPPGFDDFDVTRCVAEFRRRLATLEGEPLPPNREESVDDDIDLDNSLVLHTTCSGNYVAYCD